MVRLSYSKVNSFNTCPRQYYFSSVKKVPFISNKWMIAGNDVHRMFEDASMSDDYVLYLTTHEDYDKYKVMCDNYISYMKFVEATGESTKPKTVELKIYDKDYDFALIIDRIDVKKDGTTLITDYKTDGQVNYKKHQNQLLLYSYFLDKNTPEGIKTDYIGVFFCKHHKKLNRPVKVTKEKVDEAMNWFLEIKDKIEALMNEPEEAYEAKTSSFCAYCSHYTSGNCKPGVDHVDNKGEVVEMNDDGVWK